MSVRIRPSKIKKDSERKILIASIVSTQFLKETKQFLNPNIFQIPYAKRIFSWIKTYFEQYDEAPGKIIKDIFESEKKRINPDEIELISDFLESVSNQYASENDKESFNSKYAIDNAKVYAKSRELELKISEVNGLLSLGKIEEAESSLLGFQKVAVELSNWVDPLSPEFIKTAFSEKEVRKLFSFPGDLGDMIGPFERGKMYAFMGPLKSGKSFTLLEVMIMALIKGLNVVVFNLEMDSASVADRFYKRLTATVDNPGICQYPIIDCKNNQDGSCKKPERKNKIALYSHEDFVPSFEESDKNYRACSACRGTEDFKASSWFETINRDETTEDSVKKSVGAFKKMWKGQWRLMTYPKFSATVDKIETDLNYLEDTEDFVTDLLLVDYPALLKSNNKDADMRFQLGDTWKMLGGITAKKNCCTVGVIQTSRLGSKKKKSDVYDMAETIDPARDCDGIFILNQTNEQKKRGIITMSVGALRNKGFDQINSVNILTDLNAGQFLLDSYKD